MVKSFFNRSLVDRMCLMGMCMVPIIFVDRKLAQIEKVFFQKSMTIALLF
jgi:hypothetical protein